MHGRSENAFVAPPTLDSLLGELLDSARYDLLLTIAESHPLDVKAFLEFDRRLGGPGIFNINTPEGSGRYVIPDRDVFRPFQYIATEFHHDTESVKWRTRSIIHMSGLHIESLVLRVGEIRFLPLGAALRNQRVKSRVGTAVWGQLQQFSKIYNLAKHELEHGKDTHLFSIEDAVLAYIVSRMLGKILYPWARLETPMERFQ